MRTALIKKLVMFIVLAVMVISMLAGFFSLVPRSSCSGKAIVIVVPQDYPREKLDAFIKLVEHNIAKNLPGYHVCIASVRDVGVSLRAYPAILVKGNVSSLLIAFAAGKVKDYTLIDYGVAGLLAYYADAPIVSNVKAKLLILTGDNPFSQVNPSILGRVKDIVEKLAAVNITGVHIAPASLVKVNATSYPAVVLESEADLSEHNRYVVKLGGKYYGFVRGIELQLSIALAGENPVEIPAGFVPPDDAPSWGSSNASVTVAVFDDFACPYCARFYTRIYPKAVKPFIDNGTVRFYALDYPVHTTVETLHKLLWCFYNITRNGLAYNNLLLKNYKLLLERGESMKVDEALKEIASIAGNATARKVQECVSSMDAQLYSMLVKELAKGLGVRGVPTIVVSSDHISLVFYGLPNADKLRNAIMWLQERSR